MCFITNSSCGETMVTPLRSVVKFNLQTSKREPLPLGVLPHLPIVQNFEHAASEWSGNLSEQLQLLLTCFRTLFWTRSIMRFAKRKKQFS
jgi:hypothetical protein